ncbi:hypothetical protein [Stomatohabitans albus]|uniref:hypothetical protein n=1 Tax=Stomatohabitans albus TaxID=3110766 RepID=UPI00300CDB6C
MSNSKIAHPGRSRGNWKAGLTLLGILALILAIIIPLTLRYGGDDRNRPQAQDRRDIVALFYPKNDADVNSKSDYSFLETCSFKDCKIPVIILDNTGQTYRYLVNPIFGSSVSLSPNHRLALFADSDGNSNIFFNGGLTSIPGFPTDWSGVVSQIQDDGSAVLVRSVPRHLTLTPHHFLITDGMATSKPAESMKGTITSCDGQLWRFDNRNGGVLNEPPLVDEYTYDYPSESFVAIERETPQAIVPRPFTQCLGDGNGSFALFQPIDSTLADDQPGEMGLWIWTMKEGAVRDPHPYRALTDNPGFAPLQLAVDTTTLWVVHEDGALRSYNRETGAMSEHWTLRDYFDETLGHINARVVFAGDQIIAVGKYKNDPETWIGAVYDRTDANPTVLVKIPLLTENYLDRFLDVFNVTDPQAFITWLRAQPPLGA